MEQMVAATPWNVIRPLEIEALAESFRSGQPFPHLVLDGFLHDDVAEAAAAAFPDVATARSMGASFDRVNETGKTQITDSARFPEPIARVHDALSHPDFLGAISQVTGIPQLLADTQLRGGGMHVMSRGARLDVHVDFNMLEADQLHRRLNILVFMNPEWREGWGGELELWDADVKHCATRLQPSVNRCVIFQTSEISFHGVRPVQCPEGFARCSLAGYYYTREAPEAWAGRKHSTVFRARPDERLRRLVLMPLDRAERRARQLWSRVRGKLG